MQISITGSYCPEGKPIEFSTRKVASLCVYLAANAGSTIERRNLSSLFWGSVDEDSARGSLRKALSLACADGYTKSLIGRDRSHAWFAGDPTDIDLARFHEHIGRGTERSFREALALWRGEPLQGAEMGEPAFDDWVREFRAVTVSHILRELSGHLSQMGSRRAGPQTEIALCELIVRIEPADIAASERLMRLYAADGNNTAAVRRYHAFASALKELDLNVPEHLMAFARSLRGTGDQGEAVYKGARPAPLNGIPTVALQRPNGMRPMPDMFSYAHSEVMCQLTRFRSMRCFEASSSGTDGQAGPGTVGEKTYLRLDEGMKHDYRLLLWNEPNARSLYLRCVNAHRQNTVSCVRLSYEQMQDRAQAERIIASAINTIEQDILNDDTVHEGSAFARWLDAYRLLQQFTPQSDQRALQVLEDLAQDPRGSTLSLVHASIGAIVMKRRLYAPKGLDDDVDGEHAAAAIGRALSLDEFEPFNHVMSGWLALQASEHDRALAAFQNALSLNPYSSRTLISAAEASAFCGEIGEAQLLAKRAMELSGRYAPAYFHSYLASIAYLGGDVAECLRRLKRSPENLHTLLLEIASHQECGETAQAQSARVRLERELRRTEPEQAFDQDALSRWVVRSNMTRDPAMRRRMFGALEQAGVPVSCEAG
ncbi:MAG: BTAD domain-containing putative transcriptional regulator [Pseudomonadota bacterium]